MAAVYYSIILLSFRQKQSVSYGLFCDGSPALCARWRFACAYGNHEPFYDDVCEAEMYVSLYYAFLFFEIAAREKRTSFKLIHLLQTGHHTLSAPVG